MTRKLAPRALFAACALALSLPATGYAVTTTFENPTQINLGPDSGPGDLFPSTINVGTAGTVTKATASLKQVSHDNTDDLDIALVGPGGQKVMLMSDACGGQNLFKTYTFEDGAASFLSDPGPCPTGTYKPSNYSPGGVQDNFADFGGPAGPYDNSLAAFNGGSSKGTWSLFAADDTNNASGSVGGGWTLTLDITPAPGTGPGGTKGVLGTTGFTLGSVTTKSDGSAVLSATFGGPGKVRVEDAKTAKKSANLAARKRKRKKSKALIKTATVTIARAGTLSLPIKPTARARRILRKRGSLRVKVKVTFTPTSGTPSSQTKTVKLKRKIKKRKR
jgi:hypothetical protein